MRRTPDYKGLLLNIKPKILMVAPENEDTANILIKSELDPESANHSINPAKDYGLKVLVNPFLASTSTKWYLLADDLPIDFFWREMPKFESFVDQRTRNAVYTAWMRYSVDAPTWRGVAASGN